MLNVLETKNSRTPSPLRTELPDTNFQSSDLGVKSLDNDALHLKIKNLAAQERKLTQLILEHIAEVDRRRLYLEKAYPSLFEYLTEAIGYSSGAAQRRIDAARLVQKLPEVSKKIQSGVLHLSQISKMQKICRQVKKETDSETLLLARCAAHDFFWRWIIFNLDLWVEAMP